MCGDVHKFVQRLHRAALLPAGPEVCYAPTHAPDKNPWADWEEIMTDRNPMLVRRTIIKGAGLGLIAGALADASSAESSDCVVGMAQPQIWSSEYWAKKGD